MLNFLTLSVGALEGSINVRVGGVVGDSVLTKVIVLDEDDTGEASRVGDAVGDSVLVKVITLDEDDTEESFRVGAVVGFAVV